MRQSKSDLHNRVQRLEQECETLRNHSETLRNHSDTQTLLRKIENLSEKGIEQTLVCNQFRLHFQDGQVYFPVALAATRKVTAAGKFARQC